jgi:capsular polysaccharide transport system ATP-binding protein
MIILNNVTKIYKDKRYYNRVISNLSMVIPSGFSIAVLGRNGAGKSTLLRMLGGIELPTYGKVIISGKVSWPVGLGHGMKLQLTGKENTLFLCQVYGKNREETIEIIEKVRDFCELGKHFDRPIKTYSSGMSGRFNFGVSLAFDFDYYLIDEVTGVGDPQFKYKAKTAFDKKRKEATLIMVSHDMQSIRDNCDVSIVVDKGKAEFYDDVEYAIKIYNNLR